ncbi:uncharacterized protein LOC111642227 [Centruroides sculpturatus]|uniref:uncharacterized protein LOC111642227 n=1 Tax=Centruroides sculpturatus TaxID=218467 RepID=UPI000C6E68B1|nr:uncharacterized protein LOC111642227 [Centruroides sculpturatus]
MSELTELISMLNVFVKKLQSQSVETQPELSVQQVLQTQALTFETYDETSETFENYSQQLDNFFKIKGLTGTDAITEEAKVMILINCLGPKHYQLLTNLTAPEIPSKRTFAELMKLLQNHLTPKRNILTEQHKFLSREQHNGESISNYVTSLKQLSKSADFKSSCNNADCIKSVIDLMLRVQFIRGLQDSDIREKILQQTDLTFEQTLEIALAIEASKIENDEVYKSNHFVHKIIKNTQTKQCSHLQTQPSNRNRSRIESRSGEPLNLHELHLEGLCLHCGKNNHKSTNCRIKDRLKCERCHKKGHTGKVCISSLRKQTSTINRNHNVHNINHEHVIDFDINSVLDVFVNTTGTDDRLLTEIYVNGTKVCFECDTGSCVTIISIDEFNRLQLNAPIAKTEVTFQNYTGDIFKPLGVAKVKTKHGGNYSIEDLYVVPFQKNAIVGRDWIWSLKIDINELSHTTKANNISSTKVETGKEALTKDHDYTYHDTVVKHISTGTITAKDIQRESSIDKELSQIKTTLSMAKCTTQKYPHTTAFCLEDTA